MQIADVQRLTLDQWGQAHALCDVFDVAELDARNEMEAARAHRGSR